MQAVIETSVYLSSAKGVGLSEEKRQEIIWFLANSPTAGEIIPATGGVRKVRFSGRGKGKSGGYRTIHYYAADDVPIFLMDVLDKGERADIGRAERNTLKKVVAGIADDYRKGLKERLRNSMNRGAF